ncbi:winged helix-turn-helix transcriptional regulator [Nakamurella flavida]|uniref:Winged helix-turn-helix transcriptional regulator n=1 Tax=Nakamurella flavida TaxID=363630 RepID=A0A939C422_9ACTN|nr:winged helix-turn-helix domain-containing protein [Nakamurella flavida]MBM9478290.1 winged helix-turn-helix transcriptional regulator [Nakamurella flavida]MDP9777539.1 DNA-binding transcriptional ArsR family regulator [Nakamurella flavida]
MTSVDAASVGGGTVAAADGPGVDPVSDQLAQARARALSSPLRLRILRFCLHEGRTNREIAAEFALNPGTSLHHVRTLLDTGFLIAGEGRRGRRGAREIPYRATGRSWDTPVPDVGPILLRAFVDEVEGVPPADLAIARLGLKLNPASEQELHRRLDALLTEFKDRGPDADGRPVGVMVAIHPERRRPTQS